ncbi:hypothetical protein [Sphingosinicella terrae]|uniref:hypothetical protein n=1 Tax=Sphingosinicella terrae TaxID=2172047 RepID=UPI000E0E0721|nr:hypothetical protein [Sphingosinicella terrae]
MEWTWFRSVAARLGLSQEQVDTVERAGVQTEVQHPLDPCVHIRVRPDPDWTQRLTDAWEGVLVNSRRESAGSIPLPDGRLVIGSAVDVDAPGRSDPGIVVDLAAGEYEVVVTIAHEGSEEDGDYAEYASHVFALLRGNMGVAMIEPMTNTDGEELWLEMGGLLFAASGVTEQLALEHPGKGLGQIVNRPDPAVPATLGGRWKRISTRDGAGALITVRSGHGRGSFPVFKITDADGTAVGALIDFFVDNRPYDA